MTRALPAAALLSLLSACGGGGKSGAATCTPPGAGFDPEHPPELLSSLCLLEPSPGAVRPRSGVVLYDLNTPLFSDYAQKTRAIWFPPGAPAAYTASGPLDLPVGAIVAKTFALAPDQRTPAEGRRLVETRLLVRTSTGWRGYPYVWNDAGDDAVFTPGGRVLTYPMTTPSGAKVTSSYLIPSLTQCARCHADDTSGPLHLIGPTAANLNRDLTYPDGTTANQLARWTADGHLTGAPAPAAAPRLAAAHDPASGTLDARARAWLHVNCAFCHDDTGLARTSGLHLGVDVTDPYVLGVCKPPVAAGPGSGGRHFDLVPGQPDASILVYRLEATDPAAVMPQVGRSVVDEEDVQLLRDWVTGLAGGPCPSP